MTILIRVDKMTTTIKKTFVIDKDIAKTIKQIALNKDTTQTEIVNDYLKKGIENEPELNKESIGIFQTPEHFDNMKNINNDSFDKMIGAVETKEPTNAVELKRKAQRGEY